jgi:undecaprenyl diphosphate synthase
MEKVANKPKHLAIIMDGNGRWAKKKYLPRTAGHIKGAARVKDIVKFCANNGIQYLTLFAFSSENWARPEDEVSALMELFLQYLHKEMHELKDAGVKLKVIGNRAQFSNELQASISEVEKLTHSNQTLNLIVAANYGGRWDLMQALENGINDVRFSGGRLTQDCVESYLSTAGLPDPDLLIRTGGERRISNFLLWQLAYTELYFSDTLWPDFNEVELSKVLDWYGMRERRFGRITD